MRRKPKGAEEMEFGKFYEDEEGGLFYVDAGGSIHECDGGIHCTGSCPGWN